MGPALARQIGGLAVFTLHAFNELLSSDSPTVTYKAHMPTLPMHACAPHGQLARSRPFVLAPNMASLPSSPVWVKVKHQDELGLDL